MKTKMFILTFLMMMSCPFLFGQSQSHWTDPVLPGEDVMIVTSMVTLDGELQSGESYEVAVFNADDDKLVEVGTFTNHSIAELAYHVGLTIPGGIGDKFYFKFFNGTNEYVSLTKIDYADQQGSHSALFTIEFKSVAQIEGDEFDVVYPSLQEAIDAAKNGDEITLLKDNAENVTVVQAPDVAFTINGDDNTMTGTITVDGKSQAYATAGLTIKNVNFDATNIAKDASINLGGGDNDTRYTNGVTVENCNFTGDWDTTGEEKSAIKNYTGGCKNLTVTGGTFTGLHSLMQVKGVVGIAVSDVTVSDCKNGISVGTSTNVAISGSTISATGYGVRADGEGAYTMTLTNNNISAELPVVVRNVKEVAYNLTIAGDNNNFTALKQGTNTEGYQVVFTTGDDGTYVAPTTGQFVLTAPENFNVYPVYVAKIGDLKYPSLEAALKAVTENCTVEILTDITIDYLWDCRYTYAQLSVPVTIDGNENTIYFTGEIKDNNWNTLFRFENVATVKNLTLDASAATGIERGISTKLSVTVENCTLIGNGSTAKRAVIVGEGAGAGNIGNVTATITKSTFRNWMHGVSDNQNAQDMKEIAIENCVFDNANVLISAKENVTFTGNNMSENSYVNISSYTVPNEVKVVATGNENLAANTDTKYNQINAKLENITAQEGFLTPVAEINGKNYFSLQAAINAATEGQTVKVIANVELENTVTVAAGKVVTLDLNGKVVSYESTTVGEDMITNKGKLTIESNVEGGKLTYNNTDETSVNVTISTISTEPGSELIINSGIIENTSIGNSSNILCPYAIDILTNGNLGDVAVTINGGSIISEKYMAIRQFVNGNVCNNSLIVKGGTIQALKRAINVQDPQNNNEVKNCAKLLVEGGNIIAIDENGYSICNLVNSENISVTGGNFVGQVYSAIDGIITGGTFDQEPYFAYCAFGYTCQANGDGTYSVVETEGFEIPNLDRLIAFRNAVNAGNNFKGQTVTVTDDIDLASVENWTPIGTSAHSFQGTFDGGNFTISNLKAEGETYVGLFGNATSATIKNVKIENADVKGKSMVGAIVGNLHSSTMDNCHVTGLVQIEGNYKVGGLVGTAYSSVRNSSLVAANNSYVKGTHLGANFEGDNVGGITGYNGEGVYTYSNNTVKNVTISGTRKVGGILGFIFEVAKVEGSVVENVTIESTATSEYAQENAGKMSIGGIIGQYQTYSSNNGYVNSSVVKNVTFVKGENLDFQVGPLVGGTRNNPDFAPSATVTSKDNLVYMSTITGSNNLFLMHAVAQIDETEYYTLQEAVTAAANAETTIAYITSTKEEIVIQEGANITLNFAENVTLDGNILAPNANLTINDGIISNTNSAKSGIQVNAGELTLNNVEITAARHALRLEGTNGEVVATINGGTYKLHEVTGMTQHVLNAGGDGSQVTVTIKDGIFVGPKGTSSDSGATVNARTNANITIEGGDFSNGKNNTLLSANGTLIVKGGAYDQDPTAYVAQGYVVKYNETTSRYEVFLGVAKIEETGAIYGTLAEAVNAATTSQNITLLANVTEDVTINNNLTINGKPESATKNNTFTGKMAVSNADITIKNVNFDGNGRNVYAIETRQTGSVVIENCAAKNYNLGFLQNAQSNNTTTVKNVTISEVAYGLKIDYSNGVVLDNVKITATTAALLNSNYGYKTITIKDSELNILGTWKRNENHKTDYKFEGTNKIDEFITEANLDIFNLAAIDATLKAIEGLAVSTTVEGCVVEYEEGKYYVVPGNILNSTTNKKYATLQAAIDEASANDVIILLENIEENVTINKSLTIDGKAEEDAKNSEYTGTMTIPNKELNITVQNIDFVEGCIDKEKNSHGYLTVSNCNFDGAGNIGYAITVRGGDNLTIENSTAKNYTIGMLYVPSAVAAINIKDVEVSNVTAAFNITYSGDAIFEDVVLGESVTYGIHFQIYGSRTYTVKNCDLKNAATPFYFWDKSNNTAKVTVVFEGDNDLGTKGITVNAGELKMATGATLTAAEGLTIKATEAGYVVEYNEGVYSVVAGKVELVRNGESQGKFATIQDAIDAAQDGDVVRVLEDLTLGIEDAEQMCDGKYRSFINIDAKTVTIDLNSRVVKAELGEDLEANAVYGMVTTENAANLTIEDSSEEKTGTMWIDNKVEVYSLVMQYDGSIITINSGNYKLNVGGNVRGMVYSDDDEKVAVYGGNFHLGNVGKLENGSPWIFNASGQQTQNINVYGGTYNDNVFGQHWTFEVQTTGEYAIKYDGDEAGTWTVVPAVAWVNNRIKTDKYYTYELGYVTLAEAFAAAADCNEPDFTETVTLLQNIELAESITVNAGEEVILDLNGMTLTGKDNNASGSFNLFVNKGTFEIKDSSAEGTGKITLEATTNRAWNASSSIVSNNAGTLTITSGTLEHLGGTDMAYGIDNNSTLGLTTLNVNGGKIASPYRAIRQFQNSLQDNVVIVNGGTISARAGIWMQQPSSNDNAQLGTLTINDGIFECVSNAVVIDICGGAQSNVTINGGTFSNTNENANLLLIWPLTDMNSVHENCSATMNITGGNFTCAGNGNLIGILEGADANGDVVLTGGTYSEDVNAYCAEGFVAVYNGDGTWTVMPCQEQHLVAGWNWYSTYLDITLNDLTTTLGDNGISIKNFNGNDRENIDGFWMGNLNEINPSEMYMIQTTAEYDLKLVADLLNPNEHQISLNVNWSWIGYPSNQEVAINVALANIPEPKEGDIIKSLNNGYAEYAFGQWLGTLNTMVPGIGYKYNNKSDKAKTFYYNFEATRGAVEANVTAENNYWTPNATKYPHNMTMTAVVDGMTNGNYEVAAFVNGEVRGSARPVYVETLDAYIFFLTIHGEDVEEMSFRLYDIDTDTEYDLNDRFNYSNDAHVGSVSEPYVFSRGTTGIGEAAMSNVNIYPNPTTTDTEINLQATCDKVEVFNALGVKVAEYQNVDSIDALETAGIYVIRITNNGNTQNCRLVVK